MVRFWKLLVLVLVLVAGLGLPFPGGDAGASDVTELQLHELVSRSDVVVTGTIIDVEAVRSGPGGARGIHTRARVNVAARWAGHPCPSVVEVWAPGGALDDTVRVLPGFASFAPGERVLLFLRGSAPAYRLTSNVQGKWILEDRTGGWTAVLENGRSLSSEELRMATRLPETLR